MQSSAAASILTRKKRPPTRTSLHHFLKRVDRIESSKEPRLSDFTFTFHFSLSCIGEGNGTPLQCSCLENPRDGGPWWAAIYGVTQSRTWLKWLSSNSRNQNLYHQHQASVKLKLALHLLLLSILHLYQPPPLSLPQSVTLVACSPDASPWMPAGVL